MYDPTNETDELGRKALGCAFDVLNEYKKGNLLYGEARASIQAVWQTTSGLLDGKVSAVIAQALEDMPKLPSKRMIVWQKTENFQKSINTLSWTTGSNQLIFTELMTMSKKINICDNAERAKEVYQAIAVSLTKQPNVAILYGDVSNDSWA